MELQNLKGFHSEGTKKLKRFHSNVTKTVS